MSTYTSKYANGAAVDAALDKSESALQPAAIGVTVCAQTDPRLSDARTPTAHKSSHATGQADAITPADIGAATAGHDHAGVYDPAGTASSAMSTHQSAYDHALIATAVQLDDLAAVATSGAYADLTGKPTLGTAAATDSTAYATAAQGAKADTASQPGHTHTATNISDSTTAGRVLLTAADAAAQRTALDLVKQSSATDVTPGRVALVDYVQLRTPVNDIGAAGGLGFGVGLYPGNPSALGLSPLPGCDQLGHDNYGNYIHTNGSVVCWVPFCWLRIGSASSPRYATYGANAHDCLPESAFADEAAANAAGYMLHRAFKDGGKIQRGFFVDKYIASPDQTGLAAVAVKNGVPISLTTDANYTRSSTMTGCVGQLHDAVTLSRARGVGWNATSIFIYDLLARLAMCHAQSASSVTHCAWYDATGTTNFPKGCNNALRDINDASVLYVTAGDAGAAAKGRTGSAAPFAKATHNGQSCGIADLNGLMWEAALGLTAPGSSATDSAQRADGHAWVLKDSVALASLTAGWNGATDAWQSAATIETLYDYYANFLPWGASAATMHFGNGSEPVFSGALSGVGPLRTCCGVPTATGESTNGTNLFGQDGNYRYNRANLFPLVGASWFHGSRAGVFTRYWGYHRTVADSYVGFRASAYGL